MKQELIREPIRWGRLTDDELLGVCIRAQYYGLSLIRASNVGRARKGDPAIHGLSSDDFVQEALTRLLTAGSFPETKSEAAALLFRATKYLILNEFQRRHTVRIDLVVGTDAEPFGLDMECEDADQQACLEERAREMFASDSDALRYVVALLAFGAASRALIGRILGVTAEEVSNIRKRVLRRLSS